MEENNRFLLGKYATIQETIVNYLIEKRTIISRYPAPTQEIVNINNIDYFRFNVVAKHIASFTIIQSNTETFPERFIVKFWGPNSSEIRFGSYIQDNETYKFGVAIKDSATSDPVSYLNINITRDNYEKIKEVSEMSVKNPNEQFSVQLYLELLNSLNIKHFEELGNLFGDNATIKK